MILSRVVLVLGMLVSMVHAGVFVHQDPIDAAYEVHKKDLLTKFTDRYGLVVDLDDGKSSGIGDSAFRTGLAALCMALEKDDANTQKYLNALHDNCWNQNKPIRHPDVNEPPQKTYARDQFIPQMAACYFAFQLGNDQTKAAAKQLYSRFVDHAIANNWTLNQGEAASLGRGNRFPFFEVAESMALGDRRELKNDKQWLNREAFVAAMKLKAAELQVAGENPSDFYGIHLMFVEALLGIKTRPQTDGLIPAAKILGDRLERHNMALFMWYRNPNNPKLREILTAWPSGWNRIDYVWQRSKHQQDKDANAPPDKKEYARLDYMLLRRLLEVDVRRN